MKVIAGTIVRNRDWVLSDHLAAVQSNKPHGLFYVEGDSIDYTADILERKGIPHIHCHTGEPAWQRGYYKSSVMGGLRNLWITEAIKHYPDATHLWSVDSDVIVPQDALQSLLSHDKDVIAAYVPVANNTMPIHMFGWSEEDGHPMRTGEERFITSAIRRCTLVGACVLMKRDVIEPLMPVYGEDGQGEDGYAAKIFRSNGIDQWVDPIVICEHRMQEPEEWKLKWGVQ